MLCIAKCFKKPMQNKKNTLEIAFLKHFIINVDYFIYFCSRN